MKTFLLSIVVMSVTVAVFVSFGLPDEKLQRSVHGDEPQETEQTSLQQVIVRQGPYEVVRVVDGDTVIVRIGEDDTSVRLIGIDAPESDGPYTTYECFAEEAAHALRTFVGDSSVYLEFDASQESHDVYGRLLGYVYLQDNTFVTQKLIKEGYVREYTHKGVAYRYQDLFQEEERQAQEKEVGLWGSCR